MMVASSVSADQLVRALDRKDATLPAEIAAFIAFSGCESMLEQGPRELTGLGNVRVSEHGTVVLSGAPCEEALAARSMHRVLVELLKASGTLSPALQRLRDRGQDEVQSLRALHEQLEATLVPLNRTASRRVLARFARDAAQSLMEPHDVDAALNTLLAESPPDNDAPRVEGRGLARAKKLERFGSLEPDARLQVDLLEGLDLGGEESHYVETSLDRSAPAEKRASTRPPVSPNPRGRPRSHASQLEELGARTAPHKLVIGFGLAALAVLIVIVAVSVRDQRASEEAQQQAEAAAAAAKLDEPALAPGGGDLLVHVSEPNAQVLRFVGRAPVEIPQLPVGVAHEFVATADGHRPARALIQAQAEWEATAEGARYELALQLTPSEAEREESLELGPSRFANQGGSAATRRGSVRVVTSPPGARVYQLVGFSPDVTVQDLPLDVPQELLVFREGFAPVLRVVQPAEFQLEGGRKKAQLNVQLAKHKR